MVRSPNQRPHAVLAMEEIAIAFAADARAAAVIAAQHPLTRLQRQVIARITQRAGDFLLDHIPDKEGP